MHRKLWFMICCCLLAAGCSQSSGVSEGPPEKPSQSPEMAKLAFLVGTWTGTAEMIIPTAEDMKKDMPKDAPNPQMKFAASKTYEWDVNNLFLHAQGWHEMPEGQKANFHEFIGWDPHAKKYHVWYVSDYGERTQGWMTVSDDGKTYTSKESGIGMDGKKLKGTTTMVLVDSNTVDWTWEEQGPWLKPSMQIKATMKK